MADQEIISRIKYLIKEMNYRQADFAKKIGVDTSNLSKYMNGRLPLSDSLINRIVVNLGVSKEWLEKGTDIPFAKHASLPVTTVPACDVETISMGTPVYDIDVTAGSMPRARMFADDLVVGHINLPDIISENCRIVRVSGDSMSPVIRSGDYIAVRELTNMQYIFWGQIYVVLLDDLRLVKYVRRHDDPNMVILRSENPNYDDMEISRADIRELMMVQHVLHLDTRN
ncbi:MAG: XRE family transcriptional regulator [Bacteroidales bacterium]|nr:XRE family transcriptional regulator [Bacteroidales bacterium]